MWLINSVNAIFNYWLNASLPMAFAIASAVHLTIYFVGAGTGSWLTESVWPRMRLGHTIDVHPPKPGQIRREIGNGLAACGIFGLFTLSYRWICHDLWPHSLLQAACQGVAFLLFNTLYAYATHRLLHTRWLIRVHRVHHRSVRVTPWSGYSVHVIEAVVMAATLPLFMTLVPLSLGMAFVLHAVGMLFTTCIHCNFQLFTHLPQQHWLRVMISDPAFHRLHHTLGKVNYGFGSHWPDRLFKTLQDGQNEHH